LTFAWCSENVDTGLNFIEKVESSPLVRFVRITYVRPASATTDDEIDPNKADETAAAAASVSSLAADPPQTTAVGCSLYAPPAGISYRTFIPAAVKVQMCSGAPEYETFTATWERSKAWLKCIGRGNSILIPCT
jgi:hypothetical protein